MFTENQRFSVNNQLAEIGTAWQASSGTGLGITFQEAIDGLKALQISFGVNGLASDTVTLHPTLGYLLDTATGIATHVAESPAGTSMGSATPSICPTQVAAVIQKLTGLPGKKNRGRWYFPFVLVSFVDHTGELNSTGKGLYNAFASQYILPHLITGASGTQTINPVLINRSPLPLTATFIEAIAVTGKLGTQKRRGDYGRLNLVIS